MSHGIKYRLSYTDQLGTATRIDICEKDYSGAITELTGTDSPLAISWPSEGDRFAPIRGSEARISFYSDNPYTYLPLFTAGKRKYLVNIFKGAETDILKNRGFYGNAANWSTYNFTFNPVLWSMKMDAVEDTNFIAQNVVMASGNYTMRIHCVNVAGNTALRIKYDGTSVSSGMLSDSGDNTIIHEVTFNILSGSTSAKQLKIEVEGNTFEIIEVQCYLTSAGSTQSLNHFWSGYLYPSVYQQALGGAPYVVEITAVDGLGNLKDYTLSNPAGHHILADYNLATILHSGLSKTGLPLSIFAAVPLEHNAASDDFLWNTLLNTEGFITSDSKRLKVSEIFEAVLTALNCRIYQANGRWVVARFEVYKEDFTIERYDHPGTLSEATTFRPVKLLTAPDLTLGTGILCLLDSPSLQVELPVKSITINNDLLFDESIVPGKFTDPFWSTTTNNTLWLWTTISGTSIQKGVNGTLQINGIQNWSSTKYGVSYTTPLKKTAKCRCYLKIEFYPFTDDDTPIGATFRMQFKIGSWYYNDAGWSETEGYLTKTFTWNQWNNWEVDSEFGKSFTSSDSLTVKIYTLAGVDQTGQGTDEGVLIKSLNVITDYNDIAEAVETTDEISDDNESDIAVDLSIGIAPDTNFGYRNYKGGLLSAANTRISSIESATDNYSQVNDMLIDDYDAVYSQPREILSGMIHGYLTLNNSVKDTNHANMIYMINSLVIDDKNCINEVELFEQP